VASSERPELASAKVFIAGAQGLGVRTGSGLECRPIETDSDCYAVLPATAKVVIAGLAGSQYRVSARSAENIHRCLGQRHPASLRRTFAIYKRASSECRPALVRSPMVPSTARI